MRILVMGSGGVGGYFGGRLAAAGNDVTFVARGAHLAAMQKDGLLLDSLLGEARVTPAKAVLRSGGGRHARHRDLRDQNGRCRSGCRAAQAGCRP